MKKVITIIIVFVILLSVGMISLADEITIPPLPAEFDKEYQYLYYSPAGLMLAISDSEFYVASWGVIYSGNSTVSIKYVRIASNDYSGAKSLTPNTYDSVSVCQISESVWSNFDVKDKNTNDVFFYKPTAPLYLLDNQTLLQPLRQSVTSNSRILLVCGVGILSLILLVGLFRKLYLYL
ncbi:MAG: hypothetical protein QXI16_02760 [Sulfolobaceae archaeon]